MKEKNKKLKKPKVLIFEDDEFIGKMYYAKFCENEFEAKIFNTYQNVIEVVVKEKPDIIYCDIVMPLIDGWQAIKLLKRNKETKDIPIIIVDNICEEKYVKKGLKLGAEKHICKAHFNPQQIINIFMNQLLIKEGRVKKYSQKMNYYGLKSKAR